MGVIPFVWFLVCSFWLFANHSREFGTKFPTNFETAEFFNRGPAADMDLAPN